MKLLVEGEEVESLGMRKRERWEGNPTMQIPPAAWWDLQKGTFVPFFQKDAHVQGVDGRSQMGSGLPRHVPRSRS
jgi:hypothetical protein